MACTVFHFRSDLYLLYVAVFNPLIQRLITFLLPYIYLQSFPGLLHCSVTLLQQ